MLNAGAYAMRAVTIRRYNGDHRQNQAQDPPSLQRVGVRFATRNMPGEIGFA
jgi:hypothetical protein